MGSPWPFVGRRGEFDRATAAASEGRGVLVVGPSGVGKTAFIQCSRPVSPDPLPGRFT